CWRLTNEDPAPRGSIARTHGEEWALNRHAVYGRIAGNIEAIDRRAQKWFDEIVTHGVTSQESGSSDRVCAGLHRNANGEPSVQVRAKSSGILGHGREVLFSAHANRFQLH